MLALETASCSSTVVYLFLLQPHYYIDALANDLQRIMSHSTFILLLLFAFTTVRQPMLHGFPLYTKPPPIGSSRPARFQFTIQSTGRGCVLHRNFLLAIIPVYAIPVSVDTATRNFCYLSIITCGFSRTNVDSTDRGSCKFYPS